MTKISIEELVTTTLALTGNKRVQAETELKHMVTGIGMLLRIREEFKKIPLEVMGVDYDKSFLAPAIQRLDKLIIDFIAGLVDSEDVVNEVEEIRNSIQELPEE
jgi:hypothetical protein